MCEQHTHCFWNCLECRITDRDISNTADGYTADPIAVHVRLYLKPTFKGFLVPFDICTKKKLEPYTRFSMYRL